MWQGIVKLAGFDSMQCCHVNRHIVIALSSHEVSTTLSVQFWIFITSRLHLPLTTQQPFLISPPLAGGGDTVHIFVSPVSPIHSNPYSKNGIREDQGRQPHRWDGWLVLISFLVLLLMFLLHFRFCIVSEAFLFILISLTRYFVCYCVSIFCFCIFVCKVKILLRVKWASAGFNVDEIFGIPRISLISVVFFF